MNNDKHHHKDGWTSDEIFRSMRRNCESYKKKDMECICLQQENNSLQSENDKLKDEISTLKNTIRYIIGVLQ